MGWSNPFKYPTIQPVNGSFAAGEHLTVGTHQSED